MSKKTVEAIYPLSPQQQGMLFETLAAPRSGIHVEQLTCQLADDLDRGVFARAWRALLDRHAVLRSAFAWQDQAQPLQIVVREVDMPLAEEDWRDLTAAAVADRLAAFLEADRLLGFKLTRPPLMRLTLLATGERALSLVWTHHHILMDGWCRPVLLRELFILYEALRRGHEPELPPARPYQDYVAWLGRQDLRWAEEYWRQALRGFDHPTPLGRPLPAAPGGEPPLHLTLRGSLPPAATAALQALAQELRVTLSTVVQGAWALLLSRYSGESDVAFGITVSGRPAELAGIEATIGLFINTLPLRVHVAPDEPLGRWLARLQAQTLELRRAEHVSSGQVHRWSEMPGALPLHESILVFENYPGAQAAPGSAPPNAPAEPGLPASQAAPLPATPGAPAELGAGLPGTPDAPGGAAPPGTAAEPPPGARLAASFAGNGAGYAAGNGAAAPGRGTGGQTRQPLTVLVAPGAELAVTLVHDSRRLRDAGSVLAHFLALLRQMAAGPEQPLSCLTAAIPEAEIPGFVPLARGAGVGAYAPPRTSGEEMLAILWSQVLGLHPVGIHDDFFSLGGHSLLAAQLVGLARDAFQVDVPLRALFEHPTVAGLAAEIARLQGEGERYQEALADLPVIVPDPARRGEPFPLSDVQEAYWIGRGAAFELGNVATHLYVETEIEDLNPARFERAWRRLIDRHDMLRAIVLADGRQQILARVPPYEIAVADLRGAAPAAADAALAAVREELSHQVVPADRWPLFEIRATRLAGWTRFHLSFDLLIGDAWSWLLLIGELGTLLRDPDAALPPLDLSFRDYMLAVAALAGTPLHARSLAYWRARLATLPPGPDLPLAQSPAAIGRPRFARRRRFLAAPAWSALKERAARRGLTPSGLLLAAFAEALAGWSKTPRFTLNLTLFNRLPLHPQVNQVVGDFTSLVLLEVDAAAGGTFAERARRTQRRLWDDLDHRYVSGVQVLRELGAAQGRAASLSMPVVFTSTLTLPAAAPPPAPPASLASPAPPAGEGERPAPPAGEGERVGAVRPVYSVGQTSQVWLDHQVADQAGELVLTWDAIEELFPPGTLDDMLAVYLELLARLAAGEEAWSEAAPLRLPAAHLALYAAANATAATIPAGLLHAPFLARAAERPESPALIAAFGAGARTLSYGELLRLARGLGRRLLAAGAAPGELVAVVMTKGWEQAAAVLGVLAAGGAYLPVDAELPRERRDHLLAHGGARLALTQPRWAAALEWPEGVRVLALDGTEGDDGGWPEPPRDPRALAYTIFTSGSTGLPKGVMIDHRGALNTIADVNRRHAVGAGDRVLALSSLSFDLSVWDLFGLWAAGGAAVVPEAAAGRDPGRWLALMERHGVTVWNSVPALLEMLVEFAEGRGARLPATLRLVLCSGDWLPVALPARVRALAAGPVEVVSLGGATEASIWSILQTVGEVDPAWRSIPYGRPMANQTMQVLDAALAPRPLWATGELYIGGIGLAHGYWRDPARTAASFGPAPGAAERLYRTGDLGRWRPDGVIELLGRDDFQVKIQGHRIELGEIEAALRSHPAVESAVVSAVGEPPAGRHLAAHVVLNAAGRHELAAAQPPPPPPAAVPPGIAAYLERKLGGGALRPLPADALELAAPELDQDAVARLHLARRSFRDFAAEPVAAAALGRFLSCLRQLRLGDHPLPKLRYGSAGSLYPVQVYLWVAAGRVDGVPAGTWYYHPAAHRLVPLTPGARIDPAVHAPVNRATFAGAAFSLFLIGSMDAIVPFYGERGRHYAALEAGAMTHLLETSAPACGLGLCQIGDLDFAAVRHLFGLGAEHELLHSLAGGPIDAARTSLAAFLEEAAAYRTLLDLAAAREGQAAARPAVPAEPAAPAHLAADAALRAFLRGKLPEHMVPASFSILERLPLTANGKVDRAALPRLLPDRPAAAPAPHAPPEPPRDRLEETIAALWREALHTAEVGIHDNFFTLGGHSVTMVRVYNRLRQELGREIPLLTLFEHPTIAALARHLSGGAVASGTVERSSDRGDRRREAALERRAQGRRPAAGAAEDDDLG